MPTTWSNDVDEKSIPGLERKLAIVTGSTDGIGFAIAKQLVVSGCHVIVNGRSHATCDKACQSIPGPMDLKIPVTGDLSSAEGVEKFVEAVASEIRVRGLPEVSILINNVGFFEVKDFFQVTDDEWMQYHQLNLMSGVRLSRTYLNGMIQRNWGRIIFVSSEAGIRTVPHMIPYSVSKAAQIAAARGLAETTKGTGVTVNSVLPGPTWTTGVENYMQDFAVSKKLSLEDAIEKYFEQYEPDSLIKRFLRPEEVAAVTAFLCSEMASGVNGASQRVEGGIIRHI